MKQAKKKPLTSRIVNCHHGDWIRSTEINLRFHNIARARRPKVIQNVDKLQLLKTGQIPTH